ncbi:MAG: MlaD family protein [Actinomycetota bacterium]|nr:MlaD family protein [Actinomycetota bacterium]
MRNSRAVARTAALSAVLIGAAVAVVVLLGGGGPEYRVKARFENASQLVKGNLVQVAGKEMGLVEEIELTRDGQAEVTMRIDEPYAPLRAGTLATVRQASLSGVANRYVDLRLAPQRAAPIPDGGTIGQGNTLSAVDLDQVFNVFDARTRKALQGVIQGSARQYEGQSTLMNEALPYLNPSLAASSRLFRELNRDTPALERFIVANSQLVTDIAERREDLTGLVDNLATTTTAIGSEKASLADAIRRLPGFMRRANTTFVNLRGTLDDVDPLVRESKPVAKRLRPLLADLRPFARDARPTLRDLSRLVRAPGAGNDLIELQNSQPGLRDVSTRDVVANGKTREGAFKAASRALGSAMPQIGFIRPYSVDLLGWFDDFSHTGVYDALGAASRVGTHTSAFTLLNGQLTPVPPQLRGQAFAASASLNQRNRCPGSSEHVAEDGSNPYLPSKDFPCDPKQLLPGR